MQAGTNRVRNIFLVSLIILVGACKKQHNTVKLKFLDEFILPDSLVIDNTLVGGLSGVDYKNETYYLACDDAKNPRFYKFRIKIIANKISKMAFDEVIEIQDTVAYYDLESILVEDNGILLTSEGLINKQKDPSFFRIDSTGDIVGYFEIPDYFTVKNDQKPRNNGVFEGLSRSYDNKGYWVATELPLQADGNEPTAENADSPTRITYFNKQTNKPEKQFVYQLEKVAKKPLKDFAVNGVTDLLAYAHNKFLVIERSYSSGHGNKSNDIKIFDVHAQKATNTLDMPNLKEATYVPAKKELLFDFESVRNRLTDTIIDNIEGLCFGPELPNGNKSLILVSDNNFNEKKQLNQFILMELVVD